MRLARTAVLLAAALAMFACEAAPSEAPGQTVMAEDMPLLPGFRAWIITVENASEAPARLFVARDESPMGRSVGTATPNVVPPGATQDVVFTVPPGSGWAVFVNPGPDRGPLIIASDVPVGASGRLPVRIGIDANGSPYAQAPGDPGWFGN